MYEIIFTDIFVDNVTYDFDKCILFSFSIITLFYEMWRTTEYEYNPRDIRTR